MKIIYIIVLLIIFSSIGFAQENYFNVEIISEKHDLIDHEIIFKVKNLDYIDRMFSPKIVIEKTNFNSENIYDFRFYEYKPMPKEFKNIEKKLINKTCSKEISENQTSENTTYDCSYYENIETKFYKFVNDWDGVKIDKKSDILSKKLNFEYKDLVIEKSSNPCKHDDFNNKYDCFGEKIFKITWKTPITKTESGWGSSGYYSIVDKITGINYDPWWNTNWGFRRQLNVKNNEMEYIFNMSIDFTMDTQTLINQGKMKSDCSDIRLLNESNNFVFDIAIDNCGSQNTKIYFKDSVGSFATNTYYVYYGNALAENITKNKCNAYYALCENFEDGSYSDLFDLHPYDTNGGWEIYNLGGSHGYVIRKRSDCSTTFCNGALVSKEMLASKVFTIEFEKYVVGNCGDYSSAGITDVKGNYNYEIKPNSFYNDMNNGATSVFRIGNITSSYSSINTNVTVQTGWNSIKFIMNTTHGKIIADGVGSNIYRFPNANQSSSLSQYVLLNHMQTTSCNGYLDNVFVSNKGFLGNTISLYNEESQPTTTTTMTTTTMTTTTTINGLEFNDIFNIFKTGFVDGIAGNWLIAGLILTGIILWLGLSLGFSFDSLLILTIPIILTMVSSYILSSSVAIIIGLILALLIYIIYIRLFKK